MKNSTPIKLLSLALCALALLGLGISGFCLLLLGSTGLMGNQSFDNFVQEKTEHQNRWLASNLASNWASASLGGLPEYVIQEEQEALISSYYNPDRVHMTIKDSEGNTVYSDYDGQFCESTYERQLPAFTYQKLYPEAEVTAEAVPAEAAETPLPPTEAVTGRQMEAASADEDGAETYQYWESEDEVEETTYPFYGNDRVYSSGRYSPSTGHYYHYNYTEETAAGYTVTLYVEPGAAVHDPSMDMLAFIAQYKRIIPVVLIVSILLFVLFAVYLCSSAGRKPGTEEVKPAGLNAMPLDLYLVLFLAYVTTCVGLGDAFLKSIMEQGIRLTLGCVLGFGFVGCLIFVGFCFAVAAQVKAKHGCWWKNTLGGRCLRLIWNTGRKGAGQVPKVLNLCLAILQWGWKKASGLLNWVWTKLEKFLNRLPLIWQWLAAGAILGIVYFVWVQMWSLHYSQRLMTAAVLATVFLLYTGNSFGILLEAAKKMRQGNLNVKIEDKRLIGCFKDFAEELNGLSEVVQTAAEKQLKSERMKTELITNVSHDIKTPLTSIINYADLLSKPHTPEQEQVYLEVLSRQSGQMKKLIEDLIEMSKATTGNIPVEITVVDAVEAVNQALGEFSDKLDAAGLTPVVHKPDGEVLMLADGRLAWRALSNLLSNAVKYAMPGTRLYVDISETDSTVILSIKNISRSELNVKADELLERFVRGDASRNTEGSGLGLNIAKSLMELQKGQLELLVDGDLFKVTLVFPKA